ncbi:putative sensor domain DACNV-containing protein [Polyangium aurulentum]|uniref:putative sensor domain DACNV-containing protein n=1 Tax=Polyangium aurulentum TaxID=2567896 RepID=UPI0010AEC6AC|nr:hypothetical protein [Polyangium aurulentum]UQA55481.1 hypothetical protein E8A73_029555 [Polyangium aurulentum]
MRAMGMGHDYPDDLARRVHDQLAGLRESETAPFVPDLDLLTEIFSVAFQASLMREEARSVTFRLIVAPAESFPVDAGPPAGLHRLAFDTPRPFNEDELRRLAPAAKFQRSLVGVAPDADGGMAIWGFLHSGPTWLRTLQGGRGRPAMLPPAVTVSVSRPGRLVVGWGNHTIAKLAAGRLNEASLDALQSAWLPRMFADVRQELMDLHLEHRARQSARWARVDPDLTRLIGKHFVRRLVTTIRVAHHGGSVLIVPAHRAEQILDDHRISIKYRFTDEEPRRRYRTLIVRLMNALAAHGARLGRDEVGWAEYSDSIDPPVTALDEAIFELAHLFAALADVDGAIIMTQRFELLGFGAEIAGNLPEVTQVARALDLEGVERAPESVLGVGTRHRSVYRFCRAFPDALAIVISQDGGVRYVRWLEPHVTYWDQASPDV